jgi:hypothetical protein
MLHFKDCSSLLVGYWLSKRLRFKEGRQKISEISLVSSVLTKAKLYLYLMLPLNLNLELLQAMLTKGCDVLWLMSSLLFLEDSSMNTIKKLTLGSIVLGASLLATALTADQSQALTYNVNRSWSDGFNNASLSGTVDIPVGNYTLTQGFSNPFTSIALSLTTPDGTFGLDGLSNAFVSGTGQFLITANSTSLVFSTANSDGNNPANLNFTGPGTALYLARSWIEIFAP